MSDIYEAIGTAILGLFFLAVAALCGYHAGKQTTYLSPCIVACPGAYAQILESKEERVCMCGTKMLGHVVLELRP